MSVDPTFRFMTLDWDGQIRMDPSSPYAMQRLIGLKDRFDIAFACDTDHDRHGIVTQSAGLLPPNHYLSAAIDYLFQHRPQWRKDAAVGKTVVSSSMIDRVAARLERKLYEVPVGFKWFVEGLLDGIVGLRRRGERGRLVQPLGRQRLDHRQGRHRAGAACRPRSPRAWAAIPASIYQRSHAANSASRCTTASRRRRPPSKRQRLAQLSPQQVKSTELAGRNDQSILTRAPGNDAPDRRLKVTAESGWFAARPSGTEDIYKIYAESFRGADHLRRILEEAQAIVDAALAVPERSAALNTPRNRGQSEPMEIQTPASHPGQPRGAADSDVRRIRVPRRAGAGSALVVEPCHRSGVAAARSRAVGLHA